MRVPGPLLVDLRDRGADSRELVADTLARRDKDSFNPPSSYEDRLRQLFVPIALDLEALLPEPPAPGTPKRTVDLIELSTGLVRPFSLAPARPPLLPPVPAR